MACDQDTLCCGVSSYVYFCCNRIPAVACVAKVAHLLGKHPLTVAAPNRRMVASSKPCHWSRLKPGLHLHSAASQEPSET